MKFSYLRTAAALPLASANVATLKRSEPAPLYRRENSVSGTYIIKFANNIATEIIKDVLKTFEGFTHFVFGSIFDGFAATLDDTFLELIRLNPFVEYVEEDAVAHGGWLKTQYDAPYGLARISNSGPGSSKYDYDSSAGEGTCAYVIDTGIDDSHPGFGGRAHQIKSFIDGEEIDGYGHGTHVAGILGSTDYGVAKKTTLYGIKALDNTNYGLYSGMIKGMDYMIEDSKTRNCPNGIVVNMSIYGSKSRAMNDAAKSVVDHGMFLGVCSGNEDDDASNYSPASEPSVCLVGGTDSQDKVYEKSNYGSLVDVMAPAVDVESLKAFGGTVKMSGTSMATPHVVGLAAYLASMEGLSGTKHLCDRIKEMGVKGDISNQRDDTVNIIAQNGVVHSGLLGNMRQSQD